MKKNLLALLTVCLALFIISTAQAIESVPVDVDHFPDEGFRTYILNQLDRDKDGVLNESELGLSQLRTGHPYEIESLEGVEYFTNLIFLECTYSKLKSLDVSSLTKLQNLNLQHNELTDLDVSPLTQLQSLSVGFNQITSLDVSMLKKLTHLHVSSNQLTKLDVSSLTGLYDLYCGDNKLTSLDVSMLSKLMTLSCENNQLTSLDVSAIHELTSLYCSKNNISSLVIGRQDKLYDLRCANNQITTLDVSAYPKLDNLECGNNLLTGITFGPSSKIRTLKCEKNQFASIDLTPVKGLTILNVSGNQLTSLDVSFQPDLQKLFCDNNHLTSLDLSAQTQMNYLDCHNNRFEIAPVNGRYDLSALPGFDLSRASNWNGGQVQGTILTVENEREVTYSYDLGNGTTSPFYLDVTAGGNEQPSVPVAPEPAPAADSGKTEEFVTRCYSVILGRNPDQGGLQSWAEALKNGQAAAANIIDGFVNSDEFINRNYSHEGAVSILFRAMLGRDPDPAGLAAWTEILDQGYPFGTVINGFCGSVEFVGLCNEYGILPGSVEVGPVNPQPVNPQPVNPQPVNPAADLNKIGEFVKRCYSLILNREADEGGLKGWSDALANGTAKACQIIDGFVRSDEFQNRNLGAGEKVDILYKTMLGREADEGGKAGWVDALGQGFTLQHIINGFCGSPEFTAICNDYGISAGTLTVAGALVKREAIAPEGEEAAPVVIAEFQSEYTNEEKIKAFVEHCYVAVFGREGDAEGVENYTALILNGKKTPKSVAREFVFSAEFQGQLPGNEEFIRILYRLYFDREPGAEELAGWVQMLESGASLEEIVNGFAGSAEFKAIVNEMK